MIVRLPEGGRGGKPELRRLERQLERAQLYLEAALNTGEGGPDLKRRVDLLGRELTLILRDLHRRP